MVFQDPQSALNPRRRVASIVTQPLEAAGQSWEARLARAGLLLREIGLPPETAARFPAQLSGGQRQRVNIARALCAVPRILIADEIVSGLDVSVQAQLLNLLAALRRERGFSMLFISHDLSVVRYLCDRVLVMHRGEVVESGPTEQVFAAPAHDYTRTLLAAVPPDDPAEVWRGLLKPHPEPRSLQGCACRRMATGARTRPRPSISGLPEMEYSCARVNPTCVTPSSLKHDGPQGEVAMPQPRLAQQRQYVVDEVRQFILEIDERHRRPGKACTRDLHHLFGDEGRRANQRIGARLRPRTACGAGDTPPRRASRKTSAFA